MGSFDKLKYDTYDPKKKGYGNSAKWKGDFATRFAQVEASDYDFPTLAKCTTEGQLKKEYRKLLKKYHTDIAGDTEENTKIAQAIIEEYEKLNKKFQS
jgi:DnaJ-class molecular chaperone